MPQITEQYNKRILTFASCIKIFYHFIKDLPRLISAYGSKRVVPEFREKITLATTAVNECIICARFHSEMAMKNNVGSGEIIALLNMDLGETKKCCEYEIPGLLFAQNYAETDQKPHPEIVRRLFDHYSRDIADDIIVITKKSHLFNLCGNTFGAFASRLKGIKAPESRILFEFFFVLITSPIMLPSLLYLKCKNNKFVFGENHL
jgi:AhpD family alkylhydroperoxidase